MTILLSWVAYYEDGNVIKQGAIAYGKLTQKGLKSFSLMDGTQTVTTVEPQSDERVFYRRRVFNATMPNQFFMYLLGTRSKSSVKLQVILPDGNILHDTQFRNQWYEPEWMPLEILDEEDRIFQEKRMAKVHGQNLVNALTALSDAMPK